MKLKNFKSFFENQEKQSANISSGSGIFIDSNLVMTANHVLPNNCLYKILKDNRYYKADMLFRSAAYDLALLKIQSEEKFPFVKIGESEDLNIGDEVFFFAYPAPEILGKNSKFFKTFISGIFGPLNDRSMFQILAQATEGCSGGGIIFGNSVVGVLKMKLAPAEGDDLPTDASYVSRIDGCIKHMQEFLSYTVGRPEKVDQSKMIENALQASVMVQSYR
jgi:S1-C subfamily serine protease